MSSYSTLYPMPTNYIEDYIYQNKRYIKTSNGCYVTSNSNKYFFKVNLFVGLVEKISTKEFLKYKDELNMLINHDDMVSHCKGVKQLSLF